MSPAPRWTLRVGDDRLDWHRQGRSRTTLLVVAAIWATLVLAVLLVDAAPWLMGVIGAFTLPAVCDLASNPAAGFRLDDKGLHWFSGRREAEVGWHEIDHIRLDTRLDFSVRVSVVLHSGRKIRLPYESTPPDKALEASLTARGIRVERHHFSLLG